MSCESIQIFLMLMPQKYEDDFLNIFLYKVLIISTFYGIINVKR